MKLQIEDAKTTFFDDKEHYLNFRNAWAKAVNSESAKKTLVRSEWGDYKKPGWLTSAHMLAYNALRGVEITNGFAPVINTARLTNGSYINHGLYEAYFNLSYIIEYASRDRKLDWHINQLNEFLEPFNSTVTHEMLVDLGKYLPKIKPIYSNLGNGREIAHVIIDATSKPTSFQQIWKIYEKMGSNIMEL